MNETRPNGFAKSNVMDMKILSLHKPKENYVSPPDQVYIKGLKIKLKDLNDEDAETRPYVQPQLNSSDVLGE
jgi:hypothetical protein